jgi:hypothetical protein
MSDALSEGRLGTSLPTPRMRSLHRWFVFAFIARDFTNNDATGFDRCAVI